MILFHLSCSTLSQWQCLYSALLILGLCSGLAGLEQRGGGGQVFRQRHQSNSPQQQWFPHLGNASIVLLQSG